MFSEAQSMFYDFLSDQAYDAHVWPVVWELETCIFGLVMEDAKIIGAMEPKQAKTYILHYLYDDLGFPPDDLKPSVSAEWVHSFLDHEISSILAFTREHETPGPHLLKKSVLISCMKQDSALAAYIELRTKNLRRELEELSTVSPEQP